MLTQRQHYSKDFILLNHLIWWMFSIYLLIDSLTGFVRLNTGQDLKISLLFKLCLLGLLFCVIIVLNRRLTLLLIGLMIVILFGPIRQVLMHSDTYYFALDLSMGIQMLQPFFVFGYVYTVASRLPTFVDTYLVKSLFVITIIFIGNILIGLTGAGYRSYGEGESGIGVNGFFYAGNEVGAVLVTVMCFALQSLWMKNKISYVLSGLFFIFVGVIIGTKVAILSSIFCFILIPIFNERKALFYLTKLKLVALLLLLLSMLSISYFFVDILFNLDVLSRLKWVFQERGIVALIFSGRNIFAQNMIDIYLSSENMFSYLFGLGVSGVRIITARPASELDPLDTLVWFGLIGLGVMILLSGYFLVKSVKEMANANCVYAPAVVLGNILLISAACFAGHIWTSGMLGISWALLNGLLLLNKPDEKHSKNKLVVALK